MVLGNIVEYKKLLIKEKLSQIESYKNNLKPSTRDFYGALKKDGVAFICEIKLASPSQGLIRKDVDILSVAKAYSPFANVISVLADEKFFMGSMANVKKISEGQALPVLCKDIVVSPEQIYEARFHGADGILLMLSVLDDERYSQCVKIADSLNMGVICEVHSEAEMKRAQKMKPKIIGINNRDLNTLDIDLSTTEKLLALAPKGSMIISESGFVNHQQIYRYKNKVKGFLIGTSLMRQARIDLALRELIFGRVKICGLTKAQDAKHSYELGAYYGGLNFSKTSPRCVDVALAKELIKSAPLVWGGVFVNQPVDQVLKIANELKLGFVQLHGDEEKDYIRQLRPFLPIDCAIWQARRVKDSLNIKASSKIDLVVLDKFVAGQYGGTGESFDWNLVKELPVPFALAGGINPSNIGRAESTMANVIDICSGVEESPGNKSLSLLSEIFFKLRNLKEAYED